MSSGSLPPVDTVPVIGVPLFVGDIPSIARRVVDSVVEGTVEDTRLVTATAAHGLVHAQTDPEFMQLLREFDVVLPDGMPSVWVGRLKGARDMQRCYGPGFFAEMMRVSADEPVRHYLCGGKEGVAEELKAACAEKFGNERVVGTHCPPFRPLTGEEYRALGRDIDDAGADIVWIGISTPKQERFAAELAPHTEASYIVTVGAAFDFHSGRVRQAPSWIQHSGLEWLFRTLMEPRRLWRRQVRVVPGFLYYNLLEWLGVRSEGAPRASD